MFDEILEDFKERFRTTDKPTEEEKERILIADEIRKTIETKGWDVILKEIDEYSKNIQCSPEVYYNHPDLAGYHAGALHFIKHIKSFVDENLLILKDSKYDKKSE